MPTTTKVSIVRFCEDENLLNLQLWLKQRDILTDFWEGDYRVGIWSLGRRSGKTLMSAVCAVYAGCVMAEEYKQTLRKGEPFYIICVANALDQARLALHNIRDLIESSPILKPLIIRSTADSLELSNGAIFKALPSSSRTGRGMACPMMIMDEAAHFLDTDGNAAGDQLYQALSPSVAQFGNLGKILLLSSPWIQQGIFWDLYKQSSTGNFPYMQQINLPSWEVNPTLSKEFLEQEKSRDPEMFAVEFGASFSSNFGSFLDPTLVDAAVNLSRGKWVNYPKQHLRGDYYLSLDPAKGVRDAFSACICHYEGDRLIVDLFHQFNATWGDDKKKQVAIAEVEDWILLQDKTYGFNTVTLDQYNSASTIQRLSNQLNIQELTWTAPRKTEAYTRLKELLIAGNLDLYEHPKVLQQLKNLTVKYRTNGTFDVSGGTGAGVDYFAAALAGAVWTANQKPRYNFDWMLKA